MWCHEQKSNYYVRFVADCGKNDGFLNACGCFYDITQQSFGVPEIHAIDLYESIGG